MFGKQYYKMGRLSKEKSVADKHFDSVFSYLQLSMKLFL